MLDETFKNSKNKTVGIKQTQRALEKGIVRQVFLAKDAEHHVLRPIIEACRVRQVQMIEIPTMEELGKACGIEVGTAVAALIVE